MPIIYLIIDQLKIVDTDSEFSKLLKKVLYNSVDHYCSKYDLKWKQEYIAATFLDPRFKLFSRTPSNDKARYIKEAKQIVKNYINKTVLPAQQAKDSSQTVSPSLLTSSSLATEVVVVKKLNVYDLN